MKKKELREKLTRFRTGEFPDELYDFLKTDSLSIIESLLAENDRFSVMLKHLKEVLNAK